MATNDVRDILDMGSGGGGGGEQGRSGQLVEVAKPTKESIMNPFKVAQYKHHVCTPHNILGPSVALPNVV